MRPALLLVAIALVAPAPLLAQQATPLPPGAKIRVTATQTLPRREVGSFTAARNDTLWMQAGSSNQVAVPLATVERLEVSAGRARLKWALIGGAVGLLAGGVLGGRAGAEDDFTGTGAAAGFTVGALQGVVLGAAVGGLAAPRRWRVVPHAMLR